jgi:hypothetical protein
MRLHTQAIELLDHCLTEGKGHRLRAFIDQQIAHQPPRIGLLRAMADDLQLRILLLQEHRFDVRDQIVRLFADFGVDITVLTPPSALDTYHQLTAEECMTLLDQRVGLLGEADRKLLWETVQASLDIAAQISDDIHLIESLQLYLLDWLEALHINELQHLAEPPSTSPDRYLQ